MRGMFRKSWVVGVCLLLAAGVALGQENVSSLTMQGAELKNLFTSDEDIEAGARVFRTSCALCHGGDATGGLGPDLTHGVFRHGSSDAALFRNILTGIPGSDMVGVYRPDTEIWRVVSFVRSLSAGAEEVEVPGDPKAGERIYQSRGSCIDCHRVNGKGGRLGPDLSKVGWIRSPQHLEASLRRPSEFITAAYRQVSVATKDGEYAFGRLLNENTFSVQLMDDLENLRSFMKEDLASFSKPEESMMPAFDGFFNATEIQHLVAYLYSLKGDS